MRRYLATVWVTAALVAGCGGGGDDTAASDDRYTIAVMPKGIGHQFWLTVRAGAEAAGEEFGAEIVWNGPAQETEIAEQINIFQDMVSRGVDAIVLAACDAQALIDPVHAAMDNGMPVITMDSGIESERPLSFVATDNIAAAIAAADTLAELIGPDGGKVGQIPIVPGAATSEMREQGFKEGLEKYPNLELVSTIYSYSDAAKGMNATEDMMTANPDLAGIFVANEPACIGAARAIEAAGKAGDVKLVCFDAAEEQISALEQGTVHALVVQNPFAMGYESVKAAIDHLEGRTIESRIDTGVAIVTKENLTDEDIRKLLNPQ